MSKLFEVVLSNTLVLCYLLPTWTLKVQPCMGGKVVVCCVFRQAKLKNYEKSTFFIMCTRGSCKTHEEKWRKMFVSQRLVVTPKKLVDFHKLVAHLEFCSFLFFFYINAHVHDAGPWGEMFSEKWTYLILTHRSQNYLIGDNCMLIDYFLDWQISLNFFFANNILIKKVIVVSHFNKFLKIRLLRALL